MIKKMLITMGLFSLFDCESFSVANIRQQHIDRIGRQIWQNEASGKEELLVFWNKHESFPSLGIGHNIWLPRGSEVVYEQGFPLLCDYFKRHGVKLPAWIEEAKNVGAPWQSREEFYKDHDRIRELRQLLVKTIDLQMQFMVERLTKRLPDIIDASPIEQREKVANYLNKMLSFPLGLYALIDYINFKGDGLNPKEESKGQRWGLLSVLLDMPESLTQENIMRAFVVSAAKKMLMLIENSAPDYSKVIWLEGWMKRLNTYNNTNLIA